MCILPSPSAAVPTPAHVLPPATRQQLLLDALTGCPITDLARRHDVSRKFIYQQRDRAHDALDRLRALLSW